MEKCKSINAFKVLKGRIMAGRDPSRRTLVIPNGTCGQASGSKDLILIAKNKLLEKELTEKVHLRITGCHGFCQLEPSILIEPSGVFYPRVAAEDVEKIIDAAARDKVLEDRVYVSPGDGRRIPLQKDIPFFAGQTRIILSRNEKIDPIRLFNYLENGGYTAFADVLESGDRAAVIAEIKASGLRGRGGAGFPTGFKWERLAAQPGPRGKFLVCNADEGDPGAYMDRSVLEGNPHSILEGMLIGAFATGATEGILYVRNEYPMAIKHLLIAINQAGDMGLLGDNILGTGFSFSLRIVKGAGAFVCGEETALIHSIEGRTGEPRQRPPFPVQRGINGRPTVINNVETWANVPFIIEKGAAEFARIGTAGSKGTKIFSLVGKVKNTGLVEVPMGIRIRDIVYDIGGGASGAAKIKAIQTGGPSGGCIPETMFDLAVDYDSLAQAGSIMGSGGMIVMDRNTCMIDLAKYFMAFLKDESCGKCFTCRKGTQRMHEILDKISRGDGVPEDLDLLEELARTVKDTTMCGLGQTAANPVLSTLRYFRDEYLEHINRKRCPAGVCAPLTGAPCQSACPLGTEAWRYIAHIARGEYDKAYLSIREPNPLPSVCARVCNHPCETACRAGRIGAPAIAIRDLKRFVTDRADPGLFKPGRKSRQGLPCPRVAVIGAGPAGLSAAHYLSLKGYPVTLFEAENEIGGVLMSGIPAYRLPREPLKKEMAALLDENVTLKTGTALGKDITVPSLLKKGFQAAFVAIGSHKSLTLGLDGENMEGVFPSLSFLKSFNLHNKELAKGKVGVIGGGNSAPDAARVALRQKGVESVTIYYRRSRREMPVFEEEIESALEEGVKLETLIAPKRLLIENGKLKGVEFVRNTLGEADASGRRRPVPVPGSEQVVPLDTLIVAISEKPDKDCLKSSGLELTDSGTLRVDPVTLETSVKGVFAGGDAVTGPYTVVDALASGKKAAQVIDCYLNGKPLADPPGPRLPEFYVEPLPAREDATEQKPARPVAPRLPVQKRKSNFSEVELALPEKEAVREACRCMRCDLEFTAPKRSAP